MIQTYLWKAYFWINVIIVGSGTGYLSYILINAGTSEVTGLTISDLIITIIEIISMIGLFGYCYQIKILSASIWRQVLILKICEIIYVFLFYRGSEDIWKGNLVFYEILIILGFIIFFDLIKVYALYLYTFKSKYIWSKSV